MKRLTAIAATAIATVAVTSCDKEDHSSHFSDISIESPESVWVIYGTEFWGAAMGSDKVTDYTDTTYYLSLNGDGSGIAYKHLLFDFYGNEIFDSVIFTYKTDDACHFDITSVNGTRTLTFAKESYWSGGRTNTTCVIYSKDASSGRDIYRWHRCEEMRTDTALYAYGKMKGRLSVPKSRVWKEKNIVGVYNVASCDKYEALEFYSGNRFLANKGNHELSYRPQCWGEYKITEGDKDSIFLKLDTEQAFEGYQIIFDWDGAFLYKDDTLSIRLHDKYDDCGY